MICLLYNFLINCATERQTIVWLIEVHRLNYTIEQTIGVWELFYISINLYFTIITFKKLFQSFSFYAFNVAYFNSARTDICQRKTTPRKYKIAENYNIN